MLTKTKLKLIRRMPIPTVLKLEWIKKIIDRKYREEIAEVRKTKNRDAIESIESQHAFELDLIGQEQDSFYTDQLLKKARRLRVPRPPMPKIIDGEFEESEDWELGQMGWWLTDKGIVKVREEIRKEEKWRREGRAHWMLLLSGIAGVIGTIIGLVAVLRK
jgi:hypothetical protein